MLLIVDSMKCNKNMYSHLSFSIASLRFNSVDKVVSGLQWSSVGCLRLALTEIFFPQKVFCGFFNSKKEMSQPG